MRTARWGSSRKSVRTSLYSACAGARKIREKEDGIMVFFCLVVVMARVSLYCACAGAPKIREKEDGIMAFFLRSCGDGSCIIVLCLRRGFKNT